MITLTVKYQILKYCKQCDIMAKSFHKVRKTYISALIHSGLNINEIRKAIPMSAPLTEITVITAQESRKQWWRLKMLL